MLGIVVALPHECQSLCQRRVKVGQSLQLAPGILVQVAGVGPSRALKAAEVLYQAGARAILSWGCAAALKPELAAGTLLLPRCFIIPNRGQSGFADFGWWSSLYQVLAGSLPIITTPLAGSDCVLATLAHKQALHEASGAAAADMESAFLAGWAAERRLPFAALRAIADTATTAVPEAVLADDGQGGISVPRLLVRLLLHPSQILETIALGLQFHAAHTHLTQTAEQLLPQRFGLSC